MAKKDLAGLVGGIIGKPAAVAVAPSPAENKKPGGKDKVAESRATFVCHPEQIRKLKYIALASGRLHKQVVADAFAAFIEDWESAHGVIELPSTPTK